MFDGGSCGGWQEERLAPARDAVHRGEQLAGGCREGEQLGLAPRDEPSGELLRARLAAVRQSREASDQRVARIAVGCGFGSPTSLRAHFGRALRTSPFCLPRAFRATAGAP
jgi:AraC-like DNA-binding protein